jgi:hypothetical protein
VTYNTRYVLWFKDRASFTKAQAQTGWEVWDDLALLMQFFDDMLVTQAIAADGPIIYWGDHELQESANRGAQ